MSINTPSRQEHPHSGDSSSARGRRAQELGEHFEEEVQRIAEQLWPTDITIGSRYINGREIDIAIETDYELRLIEVTRDRRKAKAEEDCQKLASLTAKTVRTDKDILRLLVTAHRPTADQRKAAQGHQVRIESIDQFRSRLIKSRDYLSTRENLPFGSVAHPDPDKDASHIQYIPLGISSNGESTSVAKISERLAEGHHFLLLGDYGAGKSMTLREIYRNLKAQHLKPAESRPQFPVFLNLRDHRGQTDPAEALERHATRIGFDQKANLTRAWRAGYVHLLLDGFDETFSTYTLATWTDYQERRHTAMELIRNFIREQPSRAGIILAGRAHFFNSKHEQKRALGIPTHADGILRQSWTELSLNEFTDQQIEEYLNKNGVSGKIPDWLPSRPLLVASLAAREAISKLASDKPLSAVEGWDMLLDGIAEREAGQAEGLDSYTVRRVLERLATKARTNSSRAGLGPLREQDIADAFVEVGSLGRKDEADTLAVLQRLPGLGVDTHDLGGESSDDVLDYIGNRSFVDEDFADVCRSGDLIHFAQSPYDMLQQKDLPKLVTVTGDLGIALAKRKIEILGLNEGHLNTAIRRAEELSSYGLLADITRLTLERGFKVRELTVVHGDSLEEFHGLDLHEGLGDARELIYRGCFFGHVSIHPQSRDDRLPRFESCWIVELAGRSSAADLPFGRFDEDCVVDQYLGEVATTADIFDLDIPLGTRVVLAILKKLYLQSLGGRKEGALSRGMDQRAQVLVPSALQMIQREGLATIDRSQREIIWRPNLSERRRVVQMIAAPVGSNDPFLERAERL